MTVSWVSQDNDSNFHVDFVVAAASLRAQNYGIPAAGHAEVTCLLGLRLGGGGSNPSLRPWAQIRSPVLGRPSELWAGLSQPLSPLQQPWLAW